MSLIAEYRFRSPELALSDALREVPEARLEQVKEVGTDPERPYLFFRARCDDFEAFERAMADDETVATVERYAELDGLVLYRVQLSGATELVIYPIWVEVGATSLAARWADGWWRNRAGFPDRDALATIRDWCLDNGIEFRLDGIYEDPGQDDASTLTMAQRETVETAVSMGYFAVPRQTSMAEVADRLGVSSQAVSERLRRAHRELVERHLLQDAG